MTEPYRQPSVITTTLRGCCPRCGESPLFVNILNVRDKCSNCGLDYKFIDTGDGPQVFAIFIVGFIAMGVAMIAEFKFGVPWWVHVILLGVVMPIIAVVILRLLKAMLIALQYKNKAEEGRLEQN